MKKKLARPDWLMSVIAGSIIGCNVAIMEPKLTIFWPGIGITQIYFACPDGLNLGTLEDNSCLKTLLDMIVVVSFAINGYHAGTFCHMAILAPGHRAGNLRQNPLETHHHSLFVLLLQTISRKYDPNHQVSVTHMVSQHKVFRLKILNGIIRPRANGMRRSFAAVILSIVPVAHPLFRVGRTAVSMEDTASPTMSWLIV